MSSHGKVYDVKTVEAYLNKQPPEPHTFMVEGTADTSAGNVFPKAVEAESPGINPTIFIIELIPKTKGTHGTDDVAPRPFSFEKTVTDFQFTQVTVRSPDGTDMTVDIKVLH